MYILSVIIWSVIISLLIGSTITDFLDDRVFSKYTLYSWLAVGAMVVLSIWTEMYNSLINLAGKQSKYPSLVNWSYKKGNSNALANELIYSKYLENVTGNEIHFAMKNPKCPIEVLDRYEQYKEVKFNFKSEPLTETVYVLKKTLIFRPNTQEIANYLSENNVGYKIRKQLVLCSEFPKDVVIYLARNDDNFLVRRNCLRRLGWPQELTEEIALADKSEDLKKIAGKILEKGSVNTSEYIRFKNCLSMSN